MNRANDTGKQHYYRPSNNYNKNACHFHDRRCSENGTACAFGALNPSVPKAHNLSANGGCRRKNRDLAN